ncbi:MAG: DNA polymerase III subunit alpha [Planctomycetota bacterium]|nr:DNA polymerase III subunit alpha [Planctomycetota bacterium]
MPPKATSSSEENLGGFIHLHLHTEYSLLDGGNKITPLIEHVKELGMGAVAITDHGNLFGAVEFYSKAKKAGIKPILGIEAYVAVEDRTVRKQTGIADGGFHLVLLAENNQGWQNLLKLSSDAFINGFYYKPRMDKSTLTQWSAGLIAINGHLGSSIAHHLTNYVQTNNEAHWQSAIEEATWHAKTFGVNKDGDPCFFIELQSHETPEQERINPYLIKLARELDLPLVCDNDAHFLRAEDWDTHDSLCCISMGKTKDEPTRLHYPRQLFVKSPQQMQELFGDIPESMENSVAIAKRCNVELDFSANHAPVVRVKYPDDMPEYKGGDLTQWFNDYCSKFELLPFDEVRDKDVTAEQLKVDCDKALRELCEAGLIWRYGPEGVTDAIRARLEREIKILADKLISAYFLIVWDFVNWARQRGIPASARGSGVGTMVGYVLGLSNACPEHYGLLFERFTDPDRTEYPDIDIDICQNGRAEVINYVRKKYGHVAQIITFGRLKAKAAIKDVARVMGLLPAEGQRLSNLVPAELNITIDAAIEKDDDFRHEYETNAQSKRVIDTANALENHARHAGVHAAGVVVATQPLDNIVPLYKASGSDDIVTQWDGPTCERVGLLKMDFLGLRTLSTIELAKKLVRETLNEEIIWQTVGLEVGQGDHPLDLDRLRYDDRKVLDLFQRADTVGIFQFESGGMRKLLLEMKPDRLEDLIAANALFRPGPMDLIPDYCARKHGKQEVPALHPIVDGFTSETYGIMVYQEQVMQIVHGLGDIPLRSAYSLIKAISKKKHEVINAERPKFIEGAKLKGMDPAMAEELFDLILKFAGYGFNKSHSTGYAIIAYQTAYLKTYFPNQYMAALLTYESGAKKVEDWRIYLDECKKTIYTDHTSKNPHQGVVVMPPDINLSNVDFTVVFNEEDPQDALHGHVRFGLSAIKGIGKNAIGTIVEERDKAGPFKSVFDFCERVSTRTVNKAAIEALIKCGTFDSLHSLPERSAAVAAIDDAIAAGQTAAEDRRRGQLGLFGGGDAPPDAMPEAEESADEANERPLPNVLPWSQKQSLELEKECLGFHVSGHPLDEHESLLAEFATYTTRQISDLKHDQLVAVGGLLNRVRHTIVRNGRSAGEKMAMITLQDKTGDVEGVVFSNIFAQHGQHVQLDGIVLLIGRVDRNRGEPQIIVDRVMPLEEATRHLASTLVIEFAPDAVDDPIGQRLEMVEGFLQQFSGRPAEGGNPAEVQVQLHTEGKCVTMRSSKHRVIVDSYLLQRLREVVGHDHVRAHASGIPSHLISNNTRRSYPKRKETADSLN